MEIDVPGDRKGEFVPQVVFYTNLFNTNIPPPLETIHPQYKQRTQNSTIHRLIQWVILIIFTFSALLSLSGCCVEPVSDKLSERKLSNVVSSDLECRTGLSSRTVVVEKCLDHDEERINFDNVSLDLECLVEESGLADQVSLIILDPNHDKTLFTLNEDRSVNIASTVKVPMALYSYDQAAAGFVDLDEMLTYRQASDYEGGSGRLQYSIQEGDQLPLGECLERAIIDSDNIATNMIFRYWRERPEAQSLTQRLNDCYGMDYDGGMATVASMQNPLIKLAVNPDDNPYYSTLLDNMSKTTFNEWITRSMKVGTYAHKFGDYGGYIGDIGFI